MTKTTNFFARVYDQVTLRQSPLGYEAAIFNNPVAQRLERFATG